MFYQTILPINDRESLIKNFYAEYLKFKTEFDLALLCNLENPLEENDKEAIFYVYSTKSEKIKKFLENFGFKAIQRIPDNLFHYLGKYGVPVKEIEKK